MYEIPFDSERKRMTVVYEDDRGRESFVKGAPEIVAERSQAEPWLSERTDAWASEGLRILMVASRRLPLDAPLEESVEVDAQPLGIIALHDPLRPTAAMAVEEARGAGIDIWMLTGDHPATARTIGHALGLSDRAIFARATPADKLRLVERLQDAGHVVAVTGDGVNDAPALRRSDVGVAMGRSGTEAAREAAAIVIADDDFATIVSAIREGRRIGDNIRKFVAFLLSANFGEVLVFAVAVSAGIGVPLAVIQVLLVNLVTDGLPAVALSQDPIDPRTMLSPPREHSRLFDRTAWLVLGAIGALVAAVTLVAFVAGRGFGGGVAQTMAFATLALSELALAFGMRSNTVSVWRLPRNRWLAWSALVSALFVAAVVYVPGVHEAFATVALGLPAAVVVIALSLVPLVVLEAGKCLVRRHSHERPDAQLGPTVDASPTRIVLRSGTT